MRFRKLRIAFSATCLIACVLLIVLWVRSYWRSDNTLINMSPKCIVAAVRCVDALCFGLIRISALDCGNRVSVGAGHLTPYCRQTFAGILFLRSVVISSSSGFAIIVPMWFATVMSRRSGGCRLDTVVQSLQPPHAANRDDTGGSAFGGGNLGVKIVLPF